MNFFIEIVYHKLFGHNYLWRNVLLNYPCGVCTVLSYLNYHILDRINTRGSAWFHNLLLHRLRL